MNIPEDKHAEPKAGDRSSCKICGKGLIHTGQYWAHVGEQPRHIAQPIDIWRPHNVHDQ